MSEDPIGSVEREADHYRLTLERRYPAPTERVWRALTAPEELERWLGKVDVEGREGGSYRIDFGGGDRAGGKILRWEPPHVLEYEWGERSAPSSVRFELSEEEDGGTRLELVHSRQSEKMARSTGSGWHAHLDQLAATLAGRAVSWESAYAAAKPRYDGSVDAAS